MGKHKATARDLLPEGIRIDPPRPKVTWVARSPLLKVKPIVSSDPVLFLKLVKGIKAQYPNLKLYIFKIINEKEDK